MKKSKPLLLSLLITAVIGFVVFYFELPAINLQNSEFYGFAFMLAAIFCVVYGLISGAVSIRGVFDDPQRNTARDFSADCGFGLFYCSQKDKKHLSFGSKLLFLFL